MVFAVSFGRGYDAFNRQALDVFVGRDFYLSLCLVCFVVGWLWFFGGWCAVGGGFGLGDAVRRRVCRCVRGSERGLAVLG
ncbi:hypothetical protein, partial [Pseudomonas syringae group genomosp. 7]|uniref:hypothetical protein n=1 Tax=Pseudomonas syringae group genomosp. 7 TaxID=251699 RepID=UPI00376F94FD